ncbi:hypothetical protein [Colwellia psychrerythraea]|uniref:Uncharacterized protein n=1 Tax=Colwellia psychrerythraea (strain 34H / ATCC BAA-681) TaxID=167879 RepID=Q484U0_COLP3|nr:hypothetical protein [Colwellia psychrerythraea]AAZ26293.1 hypothetical protein CPS_1687 [Colwellia psychrerythraea 34H]
MSHSKVILSTIDVTTRGLAALILLRAFPYLFQKILFGTWDYLIWFYPIVWLALLLLSVHPNFIVNKINLPKMTSWFIARIPAFFIIIVAAWFFLKSGS